MPRNHKKHIGDAIKKVYKDRKGITNKMGFQKGHSTDSVNYFKRGIKHPNWKGGESVGYWHNIARRVIIDFGYPIKKNEVVHHLDGNKKNNKIQNLVVLKNISLHARLHFLPILMKRRQIILSS